MEYISSTIDTAIKIPVIVSVLIFVSSLADFANIEKKLFMCRPPYYTHSLVHYQRFSQKELLKFAFSGMRELHRKGQALFVPTATPRPSGTLRTVLYSVMIVRKNALTTKTSAINKLYRRKYRIFCQGKAFSLQDLPASQYRIPYRL